MYLIFIYIFFWLNYLFVWNIYIVNWLDVCNVWYRFGISWKLIIFGNRLLWEYFWWLFVYGWLLLLIDLRWRGLWMGIWLKLIIWFWFLKEFLICWNLRKFKIMILRLFRFFDIKCWRRFYKKRCKKFVIFVMFENFILNKVNLN